MAVTEKEIPELDDPDFTEDDFNETPPPDIVAYNELRSCADIFRMNVKDEVLQIDPEFQRDFVWPDTAQTRFIDSLIKRLPIPSMCFAFDYKKDEWMVIDGLQRISTIIRFLEAGAWRLSKLKDIEPAIAGKTADFIKRSATTRQYYTRVQNLTIPINVLRCDFNNPKHLEYLFTIFHRLNSGGSKLNNQEIRNCIYGGNFNKLLKKLDAFPQWRKINLMKPDLNYRFVKQELILRFFAFSDRKEAYKGQVAKFLNDYMHSNRHPSQKFLADKEHIFTRVSQLIAEKIFPSKKEPEKRIPTSVMESMLVAIGKNIDSLERKKPETLQAMYKRLRNDDHFKEEAVAEGLSKIDKVMNRFKAAEKIFG